MKAIHQHNLRLIAWTVLAFCFFVGDATGQTIYYLPTGLRSLDTPVDPVNVAMGESFVALPGNPAALMSNPAGLADLTGISLRYNGRSFNFNPNDEGRGYWGLSGSVATSVGTIAVVYDHFTFAEIPYTDVAHPDGGIGTTTLYDSFIGLGFAHRFGQNVSAGIAVKTYNDHMFMLSGTEVKRPYLFDFGIQVSMPDLLVGTGQTDRLTFGVSLQNEGTDHSISYPNIYLVSSGENRYLIPQVTIIPLPRYLRAGFSYDFSLAPGSGAQLSPFGVLLTAEYRYLANAGTVPQRDFWGLGIEATIIELFKARVGAYVQPYTDMYAERGIPRVRYGLGINVPFNRLGSSLPLRVGLDYAGIPLRPRSAYATASVLNSFSASLAYDTELF